MLEEEEEAKQQQDFFDAEEMEKFVQLGSFSGIYRFEHYPQNHPTFLLHFRKDAAVFGAMKLL